MSNCFITKNVCCSGRTLPQTSGLVSTVHGLRPGTWQRSRPVPRRHSDDTPDVWQGRTLEDGRPQRVWFSTSYPFSHLHNTRTKSYDFFDLVFLNLLHVASMCVLCYQMAYPDKLRRRQPDANRVTLVCGKRRTIRECVQNVCKEWITTVDN